MIKMIASDIDGTLVRDGENQLEEELFDVILKLKKKGIYFVAASGRQTHSIEGLFAPIRDKIFYIGHNGAYVGCYGRNLFLYPMDPELRQEIVEDIKADPYLDVMIEGERDAYLEPYNQDFIRWMTEGYKFQVKLVDDARTVTEPVIKVSGYGLSHIHESAARLQEKYRGRLKITLSGEEWIDCMAPEVNKGQALKTLQESLGISPRETMAFGDQLNDLELLDRAYYSFAVANARPEVRSAARFQTDTNVNGGVLKILKQLL